MVLQCDSFRRQLSHIMTMMQIHNTTCWFQLDLQDCIRSTGESISKTCSSIAEKCVPDSSILATWYVPYLPMWLLDLCLSSTLTTRHTINYTYIYNTWSFLSFSSNLVGHTFEPPCRICSWHLSFILPPFPMLSQGGHWTLASWLLVACHNTSLWRLHMKWFIRKDTAYSLYCWWKKSGATWDVKNPVNTGITCLSTGAGFLPSIVTWM